MGKISFVIAFFITVILSAYTYLTYYSNVIKDPEISKNNSDNYPIILLEDFTYFQYKRHKAIEVFSAKEGVFYASNALQANGNVSLIRFAEDGSKETLKSDFLTLRLNSKSFTDLFKSVDVYAAELNGNVIINDKGRRLKTDAAIYEIKKGIIHSNSEVEIIVSPHNLIGKNGFIYNLKNKDFKILGPIKGVSN